MTEDTPQNPEATRRRLTLALGASALVGGLGCATHLATVDPMMKITKVTEGDVVLTDTLLAMSALDAEPAAAQGQARHVAFLGKAHTYVLTYGGDKLLQLAQQLDGNQLSLQPFTTRISLHDKGSRLNLEDGKLWGTLRLRYAPLPAQATSAQIEQEKALLRRLGFVTSEGSPYIEIEVHGVVRPAIALPPDMPALRRTHEIVFRAPPSAERRPDLGRIALVPVAVTVDILATPLYLAGLAIWGIGKIAY